MDLDWSHQHKRMTSNLQAKLDGLLASYASPRQVMSIIATAIIPSLAYAFPVTPCNAAKLKQWDTLIVQAVKKTWRLMRCAPTSMIMEDTSAFGLGSPSIAVEYHARTAEALITSLEHTSTRHKNITRGLLNAQLEELMKDAKPHNIQGAATPKSLKKRLHCNLRTCQLLSVHSSKLHLVLNGDEPYLTALNSITGTIFIPHNLAGWVTCVAHQLLDLKINGLQDLLQLDTQGNLYVIDGSTLTHCFGPTQPRHIIALNRLAAILNINLTYTHDDQLVPQDILDPEIPFQLQRYKNKDPKLPIDDRKANRSPTSVPGLSAFLT